LRQWRQWRQYLELGEAALEEDDADVADVAGVGEAVLVAVLVADVGATEEDSFAVQSSYTGRSGP